MRKDTFFSKIFTVFLLVISFSSGVYAEATTMSDSLKDDVTAMITNAKKLPHQIFIVDSSESMNTSAYSDYLDTCADGKTNLEKALALCNNAVKQCHNVESNAMCDVDLGCGDVQSKCTEIEKLKTKLNAQCLKAETILGKVGVYETDAYDGSKAKKYVGPWDPSKFYDDDLCFYDWTADTNSDVIEGTKAYEDEMARAKQAAADANEAEGTDIYTADDFLNLGNLYGGSANEYNKQKLCQKWGKTGEDCDKAFNNLKAQSGGYVTDRRDWDCLTDGSGTFLHKSADLDTDSWQQMKADKGGVSGLWLNWKYATSLDAIKIILANIHEFSFPPRKRGDDECYRSVYIPYQEYQDAIVCSDDDVAAGNFGCQEAGAPVNCSEADVENHETENSNCDSESAVGTPKYVTRKACFVAFEPTLGENEEKLKSLRTAIDSMWTVQQKVPDVDAEASENNACDPTKCDSFMGDFVHKFPIHKANDYGNYTTDSSQCDKCYKWELNADNTGVFVETDCHSFSGTTEGAGETKTLGSVDETLSKQCCKAFNCTNPKCRDNDICCKDNAGAYPDAAHGGDENLEGYKTCRKVGEGGADYSCVLGFYSEYDQDANHCCAESSCAEAGTPSTYHDDFLDMDCDKCDTGSALGSDTFETTTGVVKILPHAVDDDGNPLAYCGVNSTEDNCQDIKVTVGIKSGATVNYDEISSIKFTVYYDCEDSGNDHPDHLLGTGTCSSASTCEAVVSGDLSGCSEEGYRMEAFVTVTRKSCHFSEMNVKFDVGYSFGDFKDGAYEGYAHGTYSNRTVFQTDEAFYNTYSYQTTSSADKVYEYECKASFYNREVVTLDGGSCPSASNAPSYINQGREGEKVEFCEARTYEREVLARDQWLQPTKVACSWLCRTAETYDDPWKCASFFYMMDDIQRNGPESCKNGECKSAMTSNSALESCCKCVSQSQGQYYHHETPGQVQMSSGTYTCAVSGYQYATGSNGFTTTAGGFQAEIINGHTKEGGTDGYYNLSPYRIQNEAGETVLWSPYPEQNGWYTQFSLIHSVNGRRYLGDSLTSLFTTNDPSGRISVCINDLLWNWEGEDCNSCGTGCCAIDLSQDSNNCDYPQFWMKMPHGNGGKLLLGATNLLSEGEAEFRAQIKALRAVGPATLGETLYDSWRYLGGMYALYDYDYKSKPYTSPYEANDAECFTNEAVVISGGNPQFDDNYELERIGAATCSATFQVYQTAAQVPTDKPCIKNSGYDDESLKNWSATQHNPYLTDQWEKSSLMNVARFVNRNTFWSKDESCRHASIQENGDGYSTECGGNNPNAQDMDANIPLIDRVHAIGIGEWGLTAMYQVLTGNNPDATFIDASFIQNTATITERDGEQGRYYTLTATENTGSGSQTCNDGAGGSFNDLTCLFSSFVNQPRSTDVVVGRPHWTSSLVQPYDVEEKYRGPEAFTAGTVPVDGTVSRFWFGNLKKYEISSESGGSCPIYDDNTAKCGEWKRQTFDALDCFGKQAGDVGGGFSVPEGGSEENLKQFEKLMIGGAAAQLRKMAEESPACGEFPCFKSSDRKFYYDLDGSMHDLKSTDGGELLYKFKPFKTNLTADTLNRIFDYMAGYDSFKTTDDARKKIRYSEGTGEETFMVDDPFSVDFNHTTKLTLRPLLLGAIVHSKPVAVYYNNSSTTRIYAGANDGMLHAFDEEGKEVYAYMPTPAFKNITNFANSNSTISFNATVDGPITLFHIDQSHDGIINNGEKAFLIFGYRRGAAGYTVIDVSNPGKPEFVQHLNTDAGYSFAKAMIFRKCLGQCSYANDLEYYLAVPGGYDTCHDPAALTTADEDNYTTCEQNGLTGNKFRLYKFDKNDNRFSSYVEFSTANSSPLGEFEKSWLVTSFTATPFIVNTSGKAAVNTEYVYFTDLSGTVFRVDVTSNSMSDWTAKVVYAKRNGGSGTTLKEVSWDEVGRTFVGATFFPPLERYNPSRKSSGTTDNEWKIPFPVIAGNAANPKFMRREVLTTFYDNKSSEYDYTDLYDSDFYLNSDGESHTPKNEMIEEKHGWRVRFADNGEKGITEPLIVYDIYNSGSADSSFNSANSYSIAWNTYIPMKATKCKTFGTSSNYERYIPDGSQVFTNTEMTGENGEWTLAADNSGQCVSEEANLSLATSVGIVATEDGYDLTFGAGAEIFRKQKLTVKRNSTYIIKWYELY